MQDQTRNHCKNDVAGAAGNISPSVCKLFSGNVCESSNLDLKEIRAYTEFLLW